jgi:NAD-dependent SIR2 family protein deacetylase
VTSEVPDFRSGMNTSLQTGPGVWELRAKKTARDSKHKVTTTVKAIPTPTHMMLVKLHEEGLLKCCISQNTDGLHRRSGLPKSALCELHGNSNLEVCKKCKREYLRDFHVRTSRKVHNHLTGRMCDNPKCGGPLRDTIINFGEALPDDEFTKAIEESEKADLCLAMGSSLTVTPAADLPECVGERGQRLVICNLQRTPLDSLACLRINAKCEDVSQMVMAKLALPIPEFKLKRRAVINATHIQKLGNDNVQLSVEGFDMYGHPFSYLKQVNFKSDGTSIEVEKEPFQTSLKWKATESNKMAIEITLEFQSHYGEPPFTRDLTILKSQGRTVALLLSYNPLIGQWNVTEEV